MVLVTWNVNSIRKRIDLLMKLIEEENPDFILLQETKALPDQFPEIPGYYLFINSEKGRNGVAILTKHQCEKFDFSYDGRLVSVEYKGIIISSLYMYNGFSETSPKYKKMEMFKWMAEEQKKIDKPIIIGGDYNIVYKQNECSIDNPYAADEIYCFQQWEKMGVDTTPKEHFISWWDYRAFSFQKDKGIGLDKFYIFNGEINYSTPKVLRHYRAYSPTSDHAPVKIKIEI